MLLLHFTGLLAWWSKDYHNTHCRYTELAVLQAQDQIVQLQHELECSSVKDEEEHQQLQAKLQEVEQAVTDREEQASLKTLPSPA